jgi:hypothetical protein
MEALDQQLIFAGAALLCASTSSVLDIQECKVAECVTAPAIAGGLILHGRRLVRAVHSPRSGHGCGLSVPLQQP